MNFILESISLSINFFTSMGRMEIDSKKNKSLRSTKEQLDAQSIPMKQESGKGSHHKGENAGKPYPTF